jgi:hypothetical protein
MYNGFCGAMGEQFYWADWGSWGGKCPPLYHNQKGNMGAFSAVWCIAVILLAVNDANLEFYNVNNHKKGSDVNKDENI